MATAQPTQSDPVSIPPEEEVQFRKQADATAQKEMERQKQLLEQEDAEFKKKLEEKNLKELMEIQRHLREEGESKKSVLDAVKRGDMSALTPYFKQSVDSAALITREDAEKETAVIAEKHLRNERSVHDYLGQTPMLGLEADKKWLRETFPTLKTDAILVKDNRGNMFIADLGVSAEEIHAARELQIEKQRAERKSAEVATHIQERVKEEAQKTTAASIDETVRPPATPGVQRETPSQGRQPASI